EAQPHPFPDDNPDRVTALNVLVKLLSRPASPQTQTRGQFPF
ncbi:hypothetical protein CEXT_302401, partial [Caerostris extrusa]